MRIAAMTSWIDLSLHSSMIAMLSSLISSYFLHLKLTQWKSILNNHSLHPECLSFFNFLNLKLTRSLKADDPPFMASTMDVVALMKEQRRMAYTKINIINAIKTVKLNYELK